MFEELNKRRQAVAYNIAKSFENDIEKAIGAGYDLEGDDGDDVAKAHQVGDVHPNGKWVWTEYKPGKFDWRGIKKNATEKKQKVEGGSKEVDDFMDKVKTFNNKYTDISKISVIKTPKGNWDVSYDGHRLGIINPDRLSENTAKKMGWLKTDSEKLTGSKRDADDKVKSSSKKNPSQLETISEVEDYAKSISGVTFKNVKSRWKDKDKKAFELTYPHGGKIRIDFYNNRDYLYELTDPNGKTIISTKLTKEIVHTDWSIQLNPDELVSRRVEALKIELIKLKEEETRAKKKMLQGDGFLSDKYVYEKTSEAVSNMKIKIQELQSLIGTF